MLKKAGYDSIFKKGKNKKIGVKNEKSTERCFFCAGGEEGIRTLDTTFWSYAPLAGEYLQPLGHLSVLLDGR